MGNECLIHHSEGTGMTDKKKTMISSVPAEAFLVKDKSLKNIDAPFYKWLRENGFSHAWHKGHYDVCDWVFVNITHKLFAYGMPGVGIVKPTGNHAITLDEFRRIYEIFAGYEGLELMCFSKEELKERHTIRRYVRTPEPDIRRILIETLEKDGYRIESDIKTARQEILESESPLMVNETDRIFGAVLDPARAAELESSGRIMELEEFYVYYKGPKCSYDEFFAAVRKRYMLHARSAEDAERIFEEEKEYLRTSYEEYIAGHLIGHTPGDVAKYLFMMY